MPGVGARQRPAGGSEGMGSHLRRTVDAVHLLLRVLDGAHHVDRAANRLCRCQRLGRLGLSIGTALHRPGCLLSLLGGRAGAAA
eukprot:5600702-Heterocapsa_arctica.AAC.1